MVTTEKTIKITRGDSYGFNFKVTDKTGTVQELDAVYFSVKENPDDENYVFQKSLSDGVTQLTDGGYYVKVEPSDTKDLAKQRYYYDLELTVGDDVYTPRKGYFEVKWDVTREA